MCSLIIQLLSRHGTITKRHDHWLHGITRTNIYISYIINGVGSKNQKRDYTEQSLQNAKTPRKLLLLLLLLFFFLYIL